MGKFDLGGFGTQAAQGALGAGLGLLLQKGQDRRQLNQQAKLQALEIAGQKEMTDYNTKKQLEMWEATGYGAQKEQMKKAGINPGLMYGMGGGGAQTADIATGSVKGGSASGHSGEAMGMAMMAAQMGLLQAQKKKTEAETNNLNSDTSNKDATLPNIQQDTRRKFLDNQFLEKSLEDRLDIINSDREMQIKNLDIRETDKVVARETQVARSKIINQEAVQVGLENMLITENTQATRQSIEESKAKVIQMSAQIKKWAAEIEQGWKDLDIKGKELKLKGLMAEVEQANKGLPVGAGIQIRSHDMMTTAKQIDRLLGLEKPQ